MAQVLLFENRAGSRKAQHMFGMASLAQMHRSGPHFKTRPPRQPLGGKPFAKGVVLKTLIKKPKKPNSANRKCVLVRLSTGKEMVAYVPGIGHNLQEHNIVLCRVGRSQDLPAKYCVQRESTNDVRKEGSGEG
uniref:Small ribosomal subunit protein uS12m n=1 Tax=Timema poppense TaxID=170557 RepID=A0A7R9GT41_TIMPO|nr:unnamed protein product [Timema poppensis]